MRLGSARHEGPPPGGEPRPRRPLLMRAVVLALVTAGAGVAGGCGDGSGGSPDDTAGPGYAGTTRMAERLARMADEVDPGRHRFANAAVVEALSRVPPPEDPARRLAFRAGVGEQLLNAGHFGDAIALFEEVLDTLEARRAARRPPLLPEDFEIQVLDHLATAHLRRGERTNCIEGWNVRACTVPVPPEGVHRKPADARRAAELYERILARRPDDLGPRWLLNVARMMTGEYPEGVPERWRIPPSAFESEDDPGRFRDVSRAMDLDMVGRVGGAAMDDFDGDGLLDVVVSSWGVREPLRFFRNEGDGTFTDRTTEAGLSGLYGGGNLVHADYDDDGFPDVFVLRGGWLEDGWPNSLLRNRGDGTFEDVTEAAGLLEPVRPSQTAAWADFDGDGRLDLAVGNETFGDVRHPLQLFRNEGDGTFTDVAPGAGADVVGVLKGVVWGDVDDDGRPDLYISRHGASNVLLRNEGPDGSGGWRFTDVTEAAGVAEPVHSFPAWFFDYDNDGRLDLFVAGYRTEYGDIAAEYLGRPHGSELPRLYRNRGDGTFEDVTARVGLDRILFAMGANYGDLDSDGWPDLVIGTGDAVVQALMPNRVFRNQRGVRFQDVTTATGFGFLHKGHGVAMGDVFGDGSQDVFQALGGAFEGDLGRAVLMKNPGHENRRIVLSLEGVEANRSAIGARIRVTVDTPDGPRDVHHRVGTGGSFGSSPLRAEIGLGDATSVRQVRIVWPGSGTVQELHGFELDGAYEVREGDSEVRPMTIPRIPVPEER